MIILVSRNNRINLHLRWIESNARTILFVESKNLLAIRFETAFFAD